ncbi:AAA family ATPase (plasmid) [Paracoccus marcusii]|uniref:AAA family ATPase n=1 Tax=Paracoccus marcusii TaxID=59779 RepID=UPI002ED2D07D|nr:AAA family ATPase [Paracoccus marcusii]
MAGWRAGQVAWSEMTRSLLIHGAPGTGKTWLARAIAGSAGLPLIAASLGDWQAAGHLGDLLREMRATFARARATAPCVLFLDELDAAGSRGSDDRHASTYRAQVIAGLLEQLDGVLGLEGVLVLAATNDPGAIDPALRRPGRLDRTLALPLPGRAGLHAILTRQLGCALPSGALDDLSRRAIGHSPAEIDAALREALSLARAAVRGITAADIAGALGLGPEAPGLMRRMAVHEASHAVAFHRLRQAGVLAGRITAVRIGATGGLVAVEERPAPRPARGWRRASPADWPGARPRRWSSAPRHRRRRRCRQRPCAGDRARAAAGAVLGPRRGPDLACQPDGAAGGRSASARPRRGASAAWSRPRHGAPEGEPPAPRRAGGPPEAERIIEGDPFEDPVIAVAITAGEAQEAERNPSPAPTAPTARTRTASVATRRLRQVMADRPAPCRRTPEPARKGRPMSEPVPNLARLRGALVDALDEAAVLRDLLGLVFWAAEAVPGPKAAPLTRGALLALDRLDLMVGHLETARAHIAAVPKDIR